MNYEAATPCGGGSGKSGVAADFCSSGAKILQRPRCITPELLLCNSESSLR